MGGGVQVNKFEHVWGSRWDGPHLGVRFNLTSHGLNLTLHKAPFNHLPIIVRINYDHFRAK